MSVTVKKNTITMTRGDTVDITINIEDEKGEPYIPVEGDVIRFAAKKSYADESPIILKDIPIDTRKLILEPADTKDLDQPSTLVYDVEITTNDGTVATFIKGTINITEEVH